MSLQILLAVSRQIYTFTKMLSVKLDSTVYNFHFQSSVFYEYNHLKQS